MLSVHETAGMLGVSDARVRRLIADGLLPAVKIGRAWAVREEDALQRLASRPRSGRPKAVAPPEWSDEAKSERAEELRGLFHACKEAFAVRPSAADLLAAETREEAAFYVAVADFFLQQSQAALVRAKVH